MARNTEPTARMIPVQPFIDNGAQESKNVIRTVNVEVDGIRLA
jgi:hypothetical protein